MQDGRISSLEDKVDALHGDVRLALKILRGESEPEYSLVARVHRTEKEVADLKERSMLPGKLGWSALTSTVGAVAGAVGAWAFGRITGKGP